MKLIPLLVLLSFGLVGCSGSKSAQPVSSETPQIELSDADEFVENPNGDPSAEPAEDAAVSTEDPAVADSSEQIEIPEPETTPSVIEENVASAPEAAPEAFAEDASASTPPADEPVTIDNSLSGGSEKTYTVQKNETLMMVAFKLYGDYGKWKELANYNRSSLKGSTGLSKGMTLKYMAPAEEFVWNPQGLPYLIRTGDTLGGISTNVYQTPKKWKMIWNNNRPLIKDPNRIFAGFTLYYLESGREVAAEL